MNDDLEREHAALEEALTALATRVEFPPAPDLAAAVRGRLAALPPLRRPWWQRWRHLAPGRSAPGRLGWGRPVLVAVVVVLVAALVVVALPGPREAVADLLGIPGIRIQRGGAPETVTTQAPTSPGRSSPRTFTEAPLGELVTLEEARVAADFPLPLPADLGPPDAARVNRDVPGGMVSLAWDPRPGLPDTTQTDTGLLLIAFRGQVEERWGKLLPAGGVSLEEVLVGGAPGLWIEGAPHVLTFEDAGGDGRMVHGRLAGNTLLWERDGVTRRLEADVSREEAIRIATSMR